MNESPVDWRGAVDRLVAELDKIEQHSLEQVLANLCTGVDICREHGFESPNIVWNYRDRYARTSDPFPEPVATFGRTDVYWRPAVNVWMTNHKRRKQTLTKAERSLH